MPLVGQLARLVGQLARKFQIQKLKFFYIL